MDEQDSPPYLREMLTSQGNLYAALSTVIASAALSIPFGGAGAVLPLVAFGAGEAIAALFVPSWPGFRAKVDRKYRTQRRMEQRQRLIGELQERTQPKERNWEVYERLCDRAAALAEAPLPKDQTTITANDIERVQDAPAEFLSLWLASLTMRDRREALGDAQLARRISEVEADLAAGRGDQNSLHRARVELLELQDRAVRLQSRIVATDAAMLSLPDVVEEIHLALHHTQGFAAGGTKLGQAVQRLRAQADIDHELAQEMGDLPPLPAQHATNTQTDTQTDTARPPTPMRAAATQRKGR